MDGGENYVILGDPGSLGRRSFAGGGGGGRGGNARGGG